MTSRRAVSGESSGSPGPFFRGENCSARGTSISDTARVSGKVSKMNSSNLMPCSRDAQESRLARESRNWIGLKFTDGGLHLGRHRTPL